MNAIKVYIIIPSSVVDGGGVINEHCGTAMQPKQLKEVLQKRRLPGDPRALLQETFVTAFHWNQSNNSTTKLLLTPRCTYQTIFLQNTVDVWYSIDNDVVSGDSGDGTEIYPLGADIVEIHVQTVAKLANEQLPAADLIDSAAFSAAVQDGKLVQQVSSSQMFNAFVLFCVFFSHAPYQKYKAR